MFRFASQRLTSALRTAVFNNSSRVPAAASGIRLMSSHGPVESDEEFDARYVAFFSRPDIDGWEIRKGVNDLIGMDLVPEPKIINAILRACRKVNDYALTVRILEAIHMRAETANKDIWPYILQEIQPTLTELGVSTPAELGYDKPELALKSVFDMHG